MMVKNKLDKSFGPSGTFAGYTIFIIGLITTYSNWGGLIPVLIGAFMGFSSTSTLINLDKKRIKYSNNLFGFIKTGKWINIDPTMKLGIKESNITWTTFSRSNRSIDTVKKDFRIALFDAEENEIMEISKNNSPETAMDQLNIFASRLGLSVL
ncbi:MAG: hypothetical protein Q7U54_10295 [Bacteroidales bacterium]|nr:hypothetical protein [Bacteroidales bacterium]